MQCNICLITNREQKLYKTPCGHVFHEACVKEWAADERKCPLCKEPLPVFYDD